MDVFLFKFIDRIINKSINNVNMNTCFKASLALLTAASIASQTCHLAHQWLYNAFHNRKMVMRNSITEKHSNIQKHWCKSHINLWF